MYFEKGGAPRSSLPGEFQNLKLHKNVKTSKYIVKSKIHQRSENQLRLNPVDFFTARQRSKKTKTN